MKKKALLFIHGFAGGTYDYGELINDLELNGLFDIFSYTMKGHGNLVINKVTNHIFDTYFSGICATTF